MRWALSQIAWSLARSAFGISGGKAETVELVFRPEMAGYIRERTWHESQVIQKQIDGAIEVIHTGSLYAVDDAGLLRVTWPFGTALEDLRADLELLLESA